MILFRNRQIFMAIQKEIRIISLALQVSSQQFRHSQYSYDQTIYNYLPCKHFITNAIWSISLTPKHMEAGFPVPPN